MESATTAATKSPQKQVSHGIVAIYKNYLGRGPTTVRTTITDDVCLTVIQDSLIKAEVSLVENGEAELVREMRRKFQSAMREEIQALVEEVTGRKSQAFLSDHDTAPDIAVEMVVFEPR